jgi:acyl-CoA synthetase (AMP-forming)/AMP-acid ligase II
VESLLAGEKVTEEEIKKFCAGRLADYKVPKFVELWIPPEPARR